MALQDLIKQIETMGTAGAVASVSMSKGESPLDEYKKQILQILKSSAEIPVTYLKHMAMINRLKRLKSEYQGMEGTYPVLKQFDSVIDSACDHLKEECSNLQEEYKIEERKNFSTMANHAWKVVKGRRSWTKTKDLTSGSRKRTEIIKSVYENISGLIEVGEILSLTKIDQTIKDIQKGILKEDLRGLSRENINLMTSRALRFLEIQKRMREIENDVENANLSEDEQNELVKIHEILSTATPENMEKVGFPGDFKTSVGKNKINILTNDNDVFVLRNTVAKLAGPSWRFYSSMTARNQLFYELCGTGYSGANRFGREQPDIIREYDRQKSTLKSKMGIAEKAYENAKAKSSVAIKDSINQKQSKNSYSFSQIQTDVDAAITELNSQNLDGLSFNNNSSNTQDKKHYCSNEKIKELKELVDDLKNKMKTANIGDEDTSYTSGSPSVKDKVLAIEKEYGKRFNDLQRSIVVDDLAKVLFSMSLAGSSYSQEHKNAALVDAVALVDTVGEKKAGLNVYTNRLERVMKYGVAEPQDNSASNQSVVEAELSDCKKYIDKWMLGNSGDDIEKAIVIINRINESGLPKDKEKQDINILSNKISILKKVSTAYATRQKSQRGQELFEAVQKYRETNPDSKNFSASALYKKYSQEKQKQSNSWGAFFSSSELKFSDFIRNKEIKGINNELLKADIISRFIEYKNDVNSIKEMSTLDELYKDFEISKNFAEVIFPDDSVEKKEVDKLMNQFNSGFEARRQTIEKEAKLYDKRKNINECFHNPDNFLEESVTVEGLTKDKKQLEEDILFMKNVPGKFLNDGEITMFSNGLNQMQAAIKIKKVMGELDSKRFKVGDVRLLKRGFEDVSSRLNEALSEFGKEHQRGKHASIIKEKLDEIVNIKETLDRIENPSGDSSNRQELIDDMMYMYGFDKNSLAHRIMSQVSQRPGQNRAPHRAPHRAPPPESSGIRPVGRRNQIAPKSQPEYTGGVRTTAGQPWTQRPYAPAKRQYEAAPLSSRPGTSPGAQTHQGLSYNNPPFSAGATSRERSYPLPPAPARPDPSSRLGLGTPPFAATTANRQGAGSQTFRGFDSRPLPLSTISESPSKETSAKSVSSSSSSSSQYGDFESETGSEKIFDEMAKMATDALNDIIGGFNEKIRGNAPELSESEVISGLSSAGNDLYNVLSNAAEGLRGMIDAAYEGRKTLLGPATGPEGQDAAEYPSPPATTKTAVRPPSQPGATSTNNLPVPGAGSSPMPGSQFSAHPPAQAPAQAQVPPPQETPFDWATRIQSQATGNKSPLSPGAGAAPTSTFPPPGAGSSPMARSQFSAHPPASTQAPAQPTSTALEWFNKLPPIPTFGASPTSTLSTPGVGYSPVSGFQGAYPPVNATHMSAPLGGTYPSAPASQWAPQQPPMPTKPQSPPAYGAMPPVATSPYAAASVVPTKTSYPAMTQSRANPPTLGPANFTLGSSQSPLVGFRSQTSAPPTTPVRPQGAMPPTIVRTAAPPPNIISGQQAFNPASAGPYPVTGVTTTVASPYGQPQLPGQGPRQGKGR